MLFWNYSILNFRVLLQVCLSNILLWAILQYGSPPQYSATVMYNVNGNTPDNIPAWYGAYQPMDFGQIGNESNPLSYVF